MAEKRERNSRHYKKIAATYNDGTHACHWCGITGVPLAVDHLIEVDRGGDTRGGTVPACKGCNSKRGAAYRNAKYQRRWRNPRYQ